MKCTIIILSKLYLLVLSFHYNPRQHIVHYLMNKQKKRPPQQLTKQDHPAEKINPRNHKLAKKTQRTQA